MTVAEPSPLPDSGRAALDGQRVGSVRQEELLARLAAGSRTRPREDELALLGEIGQAMRDASICGLGQTASSAIESALRQPGLVAL